MDKEGVFRSKPGYTVTPNRIARSKGISMEAKGLYLLINSYLNNEIVTYSKDFFMVESGISEREFNHSWEELVTAGLIKEYRGEVIQYDLLDRPKRRDIQKVEGLKV